MTATEKTTHTKGPYQCVELGDQPIAVAAECGGIVAHVRRRDPISGPLPTAANARFIVRACNNHDDLLAACKLALDTLERDCPPGGYTESVCNQLRAAIAAAEGSE